MPWHHQHWLRGLLMGLVAALSTSCISRPIEIDVSEEVERVCTMMCKQNVACHEPQLFETIDECVEHCLGYEKFYAVDACGAARRAVYDCVGETTTCEEYLDTNNVHADEHICKAAKDAVADECLP